MGSGRDWDDAPAKKSIDFFIRAVREHNRVTSVRQESPNLYIVERDGLSTVRVWLCDVYTLGVADYMHIRHEDPDVNCIVTISGFNSWTWDAKEAGYDDGVAVFKFGEFLGALHREGDDFVQYEPPKRS